MTLPISLPSFIGHLATAGGLGAAIGLERQWHQGMAGLRTNALVATGASAFVSLPGVIGGENIGASNMATFLMTGIGFLGAGVIMREGANIRGLNTAATLWVTASVGAFVGAGFALHALAIAVAIVVINFCMRPVVMLVNHFSARMGADTTTNYVIDIDCLTVAQKDLRAHLMESLASDGLSLRGLETRDAVPGDEQVTLVATVASRGLGDAKIEHLVGHLAIDPAVASARWSRSDAAENDPKLHVSS